MSPLFRVHPTADVQSERIGRGTVIWQHVVVLPGAEIGEDCNLNCNTLVEGGARIGNRVTLKCGVYVWSGVTLEDDVLVGPNATFTNDLRPRSKQPWTLVPSLVKCGASIGGGASLLCGVTIGRYAMVGLGAVVTRNVPDYALVTGVPAKLRGWVDETGEALSEKTPGVFRSKAGAEFLLRDGVLAPVDGT